MLALFDSGSTLTLISSKSLPPRCPTNPVQRRLCQTTAGLFAIDREVVLEEVEFVDFGPSLRVHEIKALVFDAPCSFSLILGRDFLIPHKIDLKFSTLTIEWYDRRILMKQNDAHTPYKSSQDRPEWADNDFYYAAPAGGTMLPSKYEGIESLDAIVQAQTHLTPVQQRKLLNTLQGFAPLFEGKLGRYKKRKVHLQLKPGSKPKHLKP